LRSRTRTSTNGSRRFAAFAKLQLIDLDAAIGTGSNDTLVRYVCADAPCRVGGGIRTIERAREVLGAGATHVIVGSSLFREGKPDLVFAAALADAVGRTASSARSTRRAAGLR
jgi:phosphoribosylformimino-5-aminoimidazole carboxamide ribonucleotide (ProFAR) isomerase